MTGQPAASDPAALGPIRREVAAALRSFLDEQRRLLTEIGPDLLPCLDAMESLLAGGKRLRPAFCYWGWRAAGGAEQPEIYAVAAALELLHASALVHDDVMDASDTRRGRPAVHRQFASKLDGQAQDPGRFGLGAAILIGDLLLTWTDELYQASGLPAEVLSFGQPALNAMRTEVVAGQYLDLLSQASRTSSVPAALRVITYKTAKYTIERPMQLGAALAAGVQAVAAGRAVGPGRGWAYADARAGAALEDMATGYGIPLGIAFQLRDDLLGVFGDPAKTGKPVSGDISEGKRTVLVALARERATQSQAQVLERHLGDRELTPAAAEQVRSVLTETGAVAECEALIAASVKEAVAALDGAPIPPEARTALAALAVTATDRAG